MICVSCDPIGQDSTPPPPPTPHPPPTPRPSPSSWLVFSLTHGFFLCLFLLVAVAATEGANSVRASLAGLVLVVLVTAYLQPLLC